MRTANAKLLLELNSGATAPRNTGACGFPANRWLPVVPAVGDESIEDEAVNQWTVNEINVPDTVKAVPVFSVVGGNITFHGSASAGLWNFS